ncbi:hypothetical protein LINPERPRIM_LOCUS17050 [Linum perenne]
MKHELSKSSELTDGVSKEERRVGPRRDAINENGYTAHVMTFDVGAVLDDAAGWQAPEYCFLDEQQVHKKKKKKKKKTLAGIETVVGFGSLFRLNQISSI